MTIRRVLFPFRSVVCLLAALVVLGGGLRAQDWKDSDSFLVSVVNPSQKQASKYTLDFQLSSHAFLALSRGGFEIRFPEGTILDSIGEITVEDNHPGISYRVDYKQIYDRTLVLNLRPKQNSQTSDEDEHHGSVGVTVSITNIINPAAGAYRLKAKVFDHDNETIAGPMTSNEYFIFESFPLPQYALVPGSIRPDTIYSYNGFSLSFDVAYVGLPDPNWQPPDSAKIFVTLPSVFPDHSLDTIYSGLISAFSVSGMTLQYRNLWELLEGPRTGGTSGFRTIRLNYVAYKNGDSTSMQGDGSDSIFVFQFPEIQLVPGSLQPDTILGGTTNRFFIDVLVSSDYPLTMDDVGNFLSFDPRTYYTTLPVDFDENARSLIPGINRLRTEEFQVPAVWSGQVADISSDFKVFVPGQSEGWELFDDFSGNTLTILGATPTLQILDLEVVSPNAPRVNIGQTFALRATIANHSNVNATDVHLKLQSDGSSHFDSLIAVGDIPALDTATIEIPVTASGQPNLAEVFRVSIQPSSSEVLEPNNDIAKVFIDLPAILELDYNLFGVQGGFVSPGDRFSLTVEMKNNGDAPVTDAHYLLTTGLVEFGKNDSLVGSITVEQNVIFNFDAPLFDTLVYFVFQLSDTPKDLNSGLPAVVQRPAVLFPIHVERIEGDVVASAQSLGSSLVFPQTDRQFFSLKLKNQGQTANSRVDLRRLFVSVQDQNGAPLHADEALDISTVRIVENEVVVGSASIFGHRLSFTIDNVVLLPNQSREFTVFATPSVGGGQNFVLSLNIDDIEGVYVAGPLANQRAQIVSLDGSSELFRRLFLFTEKAISESFRIETNPCNPDEAPARFAYVLEFPTDVEFRIFTLSGQEIYTVDFPAGSGGGAEGEHVIDWDGRNRESQPVMNGVYIASIKLLSTGESVRRKIAVVR